MIGYTLTSFEPTKAGYQLFVLAGISGLVYFSEIYCGQENTRMANAPDISASANTVVQLSRNIREIKNYQLFSDNHYMSLKFALYIAKILLRSLQVLDK